MAGNLTGTTIEDTFDSLLHLESNDALTSSLQRVVDGLGNYTTMRLSLSGVEITDLTILGTVTYGSPVVFASPIGYISGGTNATTAEGALTGLYTVGSVTLNVEATPDPLDYFIVADSTDSNNPKKVYYSTVVAATYTDEQAQDAVGQILTDTATIDFTYDDATPTITADVKNTSVTYAKIQDVSAESKLLGRGQGSGAGVIQELALGSNLSLSGTTLNAASGSGGITWLEVVGTSQTAAVNTGYLLNNAGLVSLTLPTTFAVGDVISIAGVGAGGWTIIQGVGQQIHFGDMDTTTGIGGSLSSTLRRDSISLVGCVANSELVVISSIGNITIV